MPLVCRARVGGSGAQGRQLVVQACLHVPALDGEGRLARRFGTLERLHRQAHAHHAARHACAHRSLQYGATPKPHRLDGIRQKTHSRTRPHLPRRPPKRRLRPLRLRSQPSRFTILTPILLPYNNLSDDNRKENNPMNCMPCASV